MAGWLRRSGLEGVQLQVRVGTGADADLVDNLPTYCVVFSGCFSCRQFTLLDLAVFQVFQRHFIMCLWGMMVLNVYHHNSKS